MDGVLSQRLAQYFDSLLGDETADKKFEKTLKNNQEERVSTKNVSRKDCEVTESVQKKKKKKKQKELTAKTKKNLNISATESNVIKTTDSEIIRRKKQNAEDSSEVKSKDVRVSEDDGVALDKGYTDDGFKIVSSIPKDDSDVSCAFESCSEDGEDTEPIPFPGEKGDTTISRKPRETEDGFKIVSAIPPDDSDVSDAFEDGEDGFESVSVSNQQRNIKKPLIQIMNDFGIDDKVLMGKRDKAPLEPRKLSRKQKILKKRQANTLTQAAKKQQQQQQQDVLIIDYTKKRGANKGKEYKEEEEDMEASPVVTEMETMDEKQLKRVRYDVFKLGMSGFHKEKREDARVALAIKLGAKPHKNKAINYKQLLKMKKEEKKKEVEEREMKRKLGLKVPKPFKKKEKPPVKVSTAQIGRYRHGVQVISKRDITKINKS